MKTPRQRAREVIEGLSESPYHKQEIEDSIVAAIEASIYDNLEQTSLISLQAKNVIAETLARFASQPTNWKKYEDKATILISKLNKNGLFIVKRT